MSASIPSTNFPSLSHHPSRFACIPFSVWILIFLCCTIHTHLAQAQFVKPHSSYKGYRSYLQDGNYLPQLPSSHISPISNDPSKTTSNITSITFSRNIHDHLQDIVRASKRRNRKNRWIWRIRRRRFTFDECTSTRSCAGSRICANIDITAVFILQPIPQQFRTCPRSTVCLCLPPGGMKMCSWDRDCSRGEFCAYIFPRVCMSRRNLAWGFRGYKERPTPPPKLDNDTHGIIPTGGRCNSTTQCKENRRCLGAWDTDGLRSDDCARARKAFGNFAKCMCVPDVPQECNDATPCEKSEKCYRFSGKAMCSSNPFPFPV